MPREPKASRRRYDIFRDSFLAFTFSGTDCELRNRLVELGNRHPEAIWDAVPFERRSGRDRRGTAAIPPS